MLYAVNMLNYNTLSVPWLFSLHIIHIMPQSIH